MFKYLRVEPEDHYFLLTEPVSVTLLAFIRNMPFTEHVGSL